MAENPTTVQQSARSLVTAIALALQAAQLVQHAPASVADAFCHSRLSPDATGWTFGTTNFPTQVGIQSLLDRHRPT
jgi:putative acyl-CoA dehydrogenase